MRKIVLDLAVTLDGFIEGPNGEIDWCVMDEEMAFDDFLGDIDTIFYGRVSYDLWGQYVPGADVSPVEKKIWSSVHSKEKYVFSKNPQPDGKATYISSDILDKIAEIKSRPGKNIWLYGGSSLITTFINHGLIDEYRLAVHPIILGAGKPLFTNLENRTGLTLNHVKTSASGVILLSYTKAAALK